VNDDSVDLAKEFDLNLICLDAGCVIPDVFKCDLREVAAPVSSDDTAKQCAEDGVAEFQPEVETFVGQLPHTVNRVDSIRLTKDLLKTDSQMVIKSVGISVGQIYFTFHYVLM